MRPIVKPGRNSVLHLGEKCKSKAEFADLLASVHVPTADECAFRAVSETHSEFKNRRDNAANDYALSLSGLEHAIRKRIELDTHKEEELVLLDIVRDYMKRAPKFNPDVPRYSHIQY
jgi:hypothetical protein